MTPSPETSPALESLKHFARHCSRKYHWRTGARGPRCIRKPLTVEHLESHLMPGRPSVGLSPIAPGQHTTRIAILDIDDHSGRAGWSTIESTLGKLIPALQDVGLTPHTFRSSGGKGSHIYILWENPQDAFAVRAMLRDVLVRVGFTSGTKGVLKKEIEIFPKNDSVASDGAGSMFVLPFSRESIPIDLGTLQLADPDVAEDVSYWQHSVNVPRREKPKVEKATTPDDVDMDKFKAALDEIINSGEEELDYDAWRNVIFSIHHATGGSGDGLALAEAFSSKSEKADLAFLRERVWPYIKTGGDNPITAATVFDMARQQETPEELIAMFDDLDSDDVSDPVNNEKLKYKVEKAFDFSKGKFPGWLIKGVLPQTEFSVMYGVSGAGKSFVALDIACAVARGEDWRSKRTRKGKVVYICAEGVGGFRQRVKAYMMQNNVKDFDLGVLAAVPNFLQKSDIRDTIKAIKVFGKVDLVIVDTLAQVMPGGNENSSEDMGLAVNNCRGVHRATGATVMVVHHAGKDTSKGARGWSGLRAAADAELEIVQTEGQRQIRVRKMKDGLDGGAYPFELQEITIGIDEDGDSVESCTVTHLSEEQLETSMNKLKGAWEQAVYSALLNLQGLQSDDIALSELAEAVCLRRDVELNYRSRGAVTRAIDKLEQKGYLAISDTGRARLVAWAKVPAEMDGEDRVAESYKEPNKTRRDFTWRNALLSVLDEWDGQFTRAEVVATAIKRRKRLGDIPYKTGTAYSNVVDERLEELLAQGECVLREDRIFKGADVPAEKLAEGLV